MRFPVIAAMVLAAVSNCFATDTASTEEGFVSLFDAKTLNGKTVLEYVVSHTDIKHEIPNNTGTWLPRGTFALQGHPPMPGQISKVCFKNIRVKVLPD